MLSGSGDTAREEALEAGANAFLGKPCGLADLTNCVAMLVGHLPAQVASATAA
jgi:CheY-like chemotaxis protein